MPSPSRGLTRIAISPALLDRIDEIKPPYMDLTTFINFTLDTSITLGSRTAGDPLLLSTNTSSSKAVVSNAGALPVELIEEGINRNPDRKPSKKKDPYASKNIPAELVPPELQQHADLLVDFWKVKKGTRSERSWAGLIAKLNGMTPADQAKALTAAYNAGWATVYAPTDTPTQGKWKEPVTNHPAHKVFRADDLGPEWSTPSATGGKGVLDDIF